MREKLLKERAALIEAMQALMGKAESESRALTAEEQTAFDASEAKVKGIDATLERLERMPAASPHGLELIGAQVRDRAEDKPWKHFGEFLLAVRNASGPQRGIDARLRPLATEDGFTVPRVQIALPPANQGETVQQYLGRVAEFRAATGLNETVLSQGGFLVQQDVGTELIRRAYDTAQVIGRCRRFPLGPNSNGVKLPYVDETDRATGSRWGGIRVYWADEADEKTKSKPKFGRLELNLKKAVGLCYATDELLEDAVALGAFIEQGFTEEMGFALDDAVINGTGAGQPLGILTSAALVSVAKETSQAAATFKSENAAKMMARIWSKSFARSVWLINQDVLPQIILMTIPVKNVAGSENVGGGPAYLPPNGLAGAPYGTLFARPIVPIEQCATLGTVGDVILADLSQYIYIARDLQMANSIHVRFIYDETVYRFVYRVDGQPAWKKELTPYKGSATQSPFVALATRA